MKLYVLYEQTCDGEYNHRYFSNRLIADNVLATEEDYCDETGVESDWKLIEVETED